MIRINLLPHREEARKAKRQQFYAMAGAAVALGALVVFLGYTIINGLISSQAEANDFLKREIAVLDTQIAEIKLLKDKTQALLALKARGESIDEAILTSKTTAQAEALRQSSAQGVEAFMLFAYRQTPSDQLAEYAALYEQAPLNQLLKASVQALPAVFAERRAALK